MFTFTWFSNWKVGTTCQMEKKPRQIAAAQNKLAWCVAAFITIIIAWKRDRLLLFSESVSFTKLSVELLRKGNKKTRIYRLLVKKQNQNCNNGILLPKLFLPTLSKTFETCGWRPRICKTFEITRTIYSNSERSEQFL